jgi:hypothetical protein
MFEQNKSTSNDSKPSSSSFYVEKIINSASFDFLKNKHNMATVAVEGKIIINYWGYDSTFFYPTFAD